MLNKLINTESSLIYAYRISHCCFGLGPGFSPSGFPRYQQLGLIKGARSKQK